MVPRVMPDQRAAGVGVPVRRAEAGEGGDQDDAARVGHAGRQRLDLRGGADEPQAVAQPLHHGAGHEDAPFEGVVRCVPPSLQAGVVSSSWREAIGRSPVFISRKQPVP